MKPSRPPFFAAFCILATLPVICQTSDKGIPAAQAFQTHMQVSQEFGNIFSRTISIQVSGFDPYVRRVSGSGAYKVVAVSPEQATLDGQFLYDGNPVNHSKNVIKKGGRVVCWQDDCAPATDASGLSINPLLWGAPEGTLHVGQTWAVNIAFAWELGPAGKQKVTVISLDPTNDSVTLKREGEGDGPFADDVKTLTLIREKKSYAVTISGGHSRWSGLTTFRRGIIQSDALIVERPVTVVTQETGQSTGIERQYILLNAVPPALLHD